MKTLGTRAALTVICFGLASAAAAAETGDGRFTMSPVDDGFVRLDKQTGAMALCTKKDAGWSCIPMEDDQRDLRDEVDRLKAQNEDLQKEVRRLEDTFVTGKLDDDRPGGAPGAGNGGPPGGLPKLQLPSEEEVDQAVDYLESMIRKFRERFEDFGDKTDPDRPRPKKDAPDKSDHDTRGSTPL